MSGLETWTTLGLNSSRSRRTRAGKRDREAIFGAAGDRDRGDVDQIAGRREGGLVDGRRIDADLHALPQQILDEAVERLVGAVAHVIVIARKEGDAEVARLARRRAVGVNW